MRQRWIFGVTAFAGVALMGVVFWMQTDRYAFTSRPAPKAETATFEIARAAPQAPTPVTETAEAPPSGTVIVLPTVEIRSNGRTAAQLATPRAPEPPREATEPCSPWREIGPMHVDDGEPSGVRHVRELC